MNTEPKYRNTIRYSVSVFTINRLDFFVVICLWLSSNPGNPNADPINSRNPGFFENTG